MVKLHILLLGNVEYLTLKSHINISKIRWHLEIEDAITGIIELDVLEVLGDWDRIDVAGGSKCHFGVLDDID